MGKLLVLILVLAAAAAGGYFTKPTAEAFKTHVDAVFDAQREAQAKAFDVKELVAGALTDITRTEAYEDLGVASKYTVKAGDAVLTECWGAYSQIMCSDLKARDETVVNRDKLDGQ